MSSVFEISSYPCFAHSLNLMIKHQITGYHTENKNKIYNCKKFIDISIKIDKLINYIKASPKRFIKFSGLQAKILINNSTQINNINFSNINYDNLLNQTVNW